MSTSRPARFAVGDIIDGKYEVVKVLPSGGMGELYKVRHIHLNDFRVVKVLKANLLADNTQKQRFLREAKIAASIKNQYLASLFDFDALPDGSFFMVQEFIDGVTLMERIKAGEKFEVPFIIRAGQQVLSGLASLHDEGIIHRDISPDNLMLTQTAAGNAIIKIIDLGIAKPVDAGEGLTSAGFFVGKLHYASPEQAGMLEPHEKIDARTDLYSLGVVLYIVATGRLPFNADTPQSYFLKQVSEEVSPITPPGKPQVVPLLLEEFILKLLRKNRDERFSSAHEAMEALTDISRALKITPAMPAVRTDTKAAPGKEPQAEDRPRTLSQPFPLVGQPAAGGETAAKAPQFDPSLGDATVATPKESKSPAASSSPAARDHITAEHPLAKAPTLPSQPPPIKPETPKAPEPPPFRPLTQPPANTPPAQSQSPRESDIPMRTVVESPIPDRTVMQSESSRGGETGDIPKRTVVESPIPDRTVMQSESSQGGETGDIPMRTVVDTSVPDRTFTSPSGSSKEVESDIPLRTVVESPIPDRTVMQSTPEQGHEDRFSGTRPIDVSDIRIQEPPRVVENYPQDYLSPEPPRVVENYPQDYLSSDRTLMDQPPDQRTMMEVNPAARDFFPAQVPETVVHQMGTGTLATPAPTSPSMPVAPPPATGPQIPAAGGKRSGGRLALWILTFALIVVAAVGGYAAYRIVGNLTGGGGDEEVVTNTQPPTQTIAPVLPTPEPTPVIEMATPFPSPEFTDTSIPTTTDTAPPTPEPTLEPTPTPRATPRATPRSTKKKGQDKKAKVAPTPTPITPRSTPTPPPVITVREGELVSLGDAGVVDAKITRFHPPKYPRMAERLRASGTTSLSVLVNHKGGVEDVRVTKSSGFPVLDEEAVVVARKSTYAPATKNGTRVKIWKTVKVEFQRP